MNIGRTGHTATLLSNGKVLVAGGLNTVKRGRSYKTKYLASAELYYPDVGLANGPCSPTGRMATALGTRLRRVVDGSVQNYALWMGVGAAAIAMLWIWS